MKNILSNKKGDMIPGKVKVIILSLIVCFILAIFIANLSSFTNSYAEGLQCYESVRAATTLRYKGVDLLKSVNCPTKEVLIADKDPLIIKKKVADEMALCYNNFGNGAKDLFANRDNRFCVICSRISFKEENVQVNDFVKYLSNTKVPRNEETYLEYLAPETNIEAKHAEINSQTQDYLSTKQDYGVVFIYDKIAKMDSLTGAKIGAGVGATLGASAFLLATGVVSGGIVPAIFIGAAVFGSVGASITGQTPEYAKMLVLWPYDQIDKLECTYLPANQGNIK